MRLRRPVGTEELRLIGASGWKRFPPRLAEQPIFHPVLNFEHAERIARDWNARGDAAIEGDIRLVARYRNGQRIQEPA